MVTEPHIFSRYVARTNFKSVTVLNRNCCLVRLDRMEAYLDQPIFVAATILDRSKVSREEEEEMMMMM